MHSVDFQSGYTVQGGGSLMLGQEQDSLGGGLVSGQSFKGMLTNVNVWKRVLTAYEIKLLSRSCKATRAGDVYKWKDFLYGVKGNTVVHGRLLKKDKRSSFIDKLFKCNCNRTDNRNVIT